MVVKINKISFKGSTNGALGHHGLIVHLRPLSVDCKPGETFVLHCNYIFIDLWSNQIKDSIILHFYSVHPSQGDLAWEDDAGLTDMKLICCKT
jgi:hypothetical protein